MLDHSRRFPALMLALAAFLPLDPGAPCASAQPAGPPSGASIALFNPQWRVLLSGQAASELIDYCGRPKDVKDEAWVPSSSLLDLLDARLAPRLAADLESEGATGRLPGQYYRQYAAARLGNHQVIYVNGFRRSDSAPFAEWTRQPVIVLDGGANYWCAIYIKDTGRFVTFKEEGRPPRTVAFHGYA
jgi:hypothetical protein